MGKVTRNQIKMIYATAREKGLCDELLHTYVFNLTGSLHISTLTSYEAKEVIDGLIGKKVQRENRATYEQIGKVKELEYKLGWNSNPKRLKGFVKKNYKVEDVAWLTFEQASNLIEGLKKVLAREYAKKAKAK